MDELSMIPFLSGTEGEQVDFKQRIPDHLSHTICSFLNTNGGYIFIGITDSKEIVGIPPEQKIEQQLSDELQSIQPTPVGVAFERVPIGNKTIFVISIKAAESIMYSVGHIVYVRVGTNNRPLSIEEIIERASESLLIRFDEQSIDKPLEIISENLVKEYLEKRSSIRSVPIEGNLIENEKKLQVLKEDKNGKLKPTKGGVLVFCENPQEFIPNSKVILREFQDDAKEVIKQNLLFEGPLQKIIRDLSEYLDKKIPLRGEELKGFERQEFKEFPLKAIREAIVNALVHRNYFDAAEISIELVPNSITIKNPGSFPLGVTIENPHHKPRNPTLAQYLYDLGFVEKYGSGITKILKICKEHPLVDVHFKLEPFTTTVIFQKSDEKSRILSRNLSALDLEIMGIIKLEKTVNSTLLVKRTQKALPTVLRSLVRLELLGLIKKNGEGRSRRYHLIVPIG